MHRTMCHNRIHITKGNVVVRNGRSDKFAPAHTHTHTHSVCARCHRVCLGNALTMDSYRQYSVLFIDDSLLLLGICCLPIVGARPLARQFECALESRCHCYRIYWRINGASIELGYTTNYVLCNFYLILFVDTCTLHIACSVERLPTMARSMQFASIAPTQMNYSVHFIDCVISGKCEKSGSTRDPPAKLMRFQMSAKAMANIVFPLFPFSNSMKMNNPDTGTD